MYSNLGKLYNCAYVYYINVYIIYWNRIKVLNWNWFTFTFKHVGKYRFKDRLGTSVPVLIFSNILRKLKKCI